MQTTYTVRSRKDIKKLTEMPLAHWAVHGVTPVSIAGNKVTVKGSEMSCSNFGACYAARNKS